VYIDGAVASMGVGSRFPRPARIHVRFGPPLSYPLGRGARDRRALAEFARLVEEAIRRLEPLEPAA
jgi:1-acyl-sn-glycerol-3-phosphate acyltransferase